MTNSRLFAGRLAAVLLILLFLPGLAPAAGPEPWKEVDRLVSEQKYEQAAARAEELLAAARQARDEKEWTRALIRTVQLRMGLHGFETAVRFLQEQPWPEGSLHRATLQLFLGHSLVAYYHAYQWEIVQRERVESQGPADLKRWTRDQIFEAAVSAYLEVWKDREALGKIPVAELSEFLEPNDYPKEVRGTLRDAVSYFLAELLADSSFWSPAQSNDLFRLDLDALIGGEETDLAAPGSHPLSHPLVRLAAVLGDLERWHASRGNRAGELEARLERLRRLHASFSAEEDRRRIRQDLEERLPSYREIPWWSMGMAALSDFLRMSPEPDPLIRAHAVAREGAEAWPKSAGGERCRQILREIEAPDYQLSGMQNDALDRRSIQVTHKNVAALHFRAFPLQNVRQWAEGFDPGRETRTFLQGRPAFAWRAELPPTPDFEHHVTFVTPPIDEPGAYLVVASVREDFAERNNRVLGVRVFLGDLVLVSRPVQDREGGREIEILTLSGSTGEPLPGVEVRLHRYDWNQGHPLAQSRTSDAGGVARFPVQENEGYFAIGLREKQGAFLPYLQMPHPQPAGLSAALVYTDRAIYRPQQKVLWKVLVFQGQADEGRLAAVAGRSVKVSLIDPNGQEAAAKTVGTSEFGTAAGEFSIPPGRPLGMWRLETSAGSAQGGAMIRVEEYKRPTFEVTLDDSKEPLRLNRPARLTGRAKYYFGLPVVNGEVRWRVTRQPIYPWWWGWRGEGPQGANRGEQTIATGVTELDAEGTFEVAFTPGVDERSGKELTYRYVVHAEATDEGGETREAARDFRLGLISVEAVLRTRGNLLLAGKPETVTIVRQDLNGAPRPGEGSWSLVELQQPDRVLLPADRPREVPPGHHTPGDVLQPRWTRESPPEAALRDWEAPLNTRQVASGEARHGERGEAEVRLPELRPGAYRLRYETVDDFGARYETWIDLIVAGETTPLALPAVLRADRSEAKVGETVHLLAHSGIAGQTLFLEIYRGGRLAERRKLRAGQDPSLIRLPVRAEDRGGFGVRLLAVRDHQLLELSVSVFVPWDNKKLDIEIATFRDEVRPGSRETWMVKVKPADRGPEGGSPELGAAELLAYMYDRSLDLFAPHQPANPLALYPNRSWVPPSSASLGESGAFWLPSRGWGELPGRSELRGDRLRFLDDSGIGGPGGRMIAEEVLVRTAEAAESSAKGAVVGGVLGGVAAQDAAAATPPPPPPPPAPAAPGGPGAAPAPIALRSDFGETAFWYPRLLTGKDGSAAIELAVPDSVTSWSLWLHAVTRDLRAGSVRRELRSVKDLMVRPYLPRFLREGDRAALKVVVNNASREELRGEVVLDVIDPETEESLLGDFGMETAAARIPFTVAAGGSASLTFPLTAPRRVGPVAFKVTAAAGDTSDGELRALPVLPARYHLAQSRFAALRGTSSGKESRELVFEDLARDDDPTRIDEQLVVTLDAQLFYSVLEALPYLANYPYECTEQTLNRFVSTGIVASVFDRYPSVAAMARELSRRDTRFETWDSTDPNRKMSLEETPWLQVARGGAEEEENLVRVLDPRVARAERDASLAKLRKAQLPSGAFPWWPGGPPSPYMTAYILYGFAKAAERGVDVPKDMVVRGWSYLADYYRTDYAPRLAKQECCRELLTFLNYVASSYPDPSWMGDALSADERKRMLDTSFAHWREHSPYLKALLAMTLKRMKRPENARLVFDSLMDSAKTTRDEGTFWLPEDRAWLWYNDTVETHAFALRAMMEVAPEDPRRHGLVQWLFLNKKLNHWKSTRATAEAIYALVPYLEKEGQLGVREAATVRVAGQTTSFTFDPARYTGKRNHVVVPGEKIDPATSSTVAVEKETPGLLFATATWHFSTEQLPREASSDLFGVTRRYYRRVRTGGGEAVLQPLDEGALLKPGEEVEVHLSIASRAQAEYVHLRDPRPAGLEPGGASSGYRWDLGISWYEETRDSGANFFFEWLPAGEYTFRYRLRANLAGTFKAGPATLQSMYAPEFTAYSAGDELRVGE